ncbi:MAG: hypothetical protein GX771_02235 [Halomonadaceae bacterium]|nr:hypothetical protein [Halomonadaceae bacterium]
MKHKLLSLLKKASLFIFSMKTKALRYIFSKLPRKYAYGAVSLLAIFAAYWAFHVGTHAIWSIYSAQVEFVMEGRDKVERDGAPYYEVYTSQGLYSNEDSWLRFKRNSDRLQNDLRLGQRYSCKTQGFRFRLYGLQPNLLTCELMPNRELASVE